MLRNYLVVAWRNLCRNRVYSSINITSLAIGTACCLLILGYVGDELGYDRFHEKEERIYRVIREDKSDQGSIFGPNISGALVPALRSEYPEVEHAVRVTGVGSLSEFWSDYWQSWVRRGEKVLPVRICNVDPDFLELFTFPLLRGTAALEDPHTALITREMAQKLFGDVDPVGEVITIEREGEFEVRGILADPPGNSTLQFDLLKSAATTDLPWDEWGSMVSNWRPLRIFVLLREGHAPEDLERKLPELIEHHMGKEAAAGIAYHLQPLRRVHLHSRADYGLIEHGDISSIYLVSLIGLFILLLACINYVNLATARSAQRAREVGIRKVVGANRLRLVGQFLGESIGMALLAMPLALALAELVLPWFNSFTGKELFLLAGVVLPTLPFVIVIVLAIGVLSGIYPAFLLSAFQPAAVLKNRPGGRVGRAGFRKGLVVFQFSVSILLLIATGTVYRQQQFLQHREWGFNKDQVVVLPIFQADPSSWDSEEWIGSRWWTVAEEFTRHPAVLAASVSYLTPPYSVPTEIEVEGDETSRRVQSMIVDWNFLDTYEIGLVAGRNFKGWGNPDDYWHAVILNETAVEWLGLEDPLGTQIKWVDKDRKMTVVGVIEDFQNQRAQQQLQPMFLTMQGQPPQQLSVRLDVGRLSEGMEILKDTWDRLVPERPFYFAFAGMHLENTYREQVRFGRVCGAFSLLALFVACLGLFGLTSFTVEQRSKEIGIRKVLGASAANVAMLLSKEFTWLVMVANGIAWPVAWLAMDRWLEGFAYRIELGIGMFLLGGIATLLIALLTVSWQGLRAALSDPVKALRYE